MIAKRHNREDNRDNSQKEIIKIRELVCFYIPFHVISKLNKKSTCKDY
ncbi:hypothetical protein CNEO_60099 [Clostridium neonatale]|uniref:Uncharacterized protein n=1 Tax=Clostridium neonatale TaxID=137838 RepID=A0AA86JQ26_9CLOT|nr:hypothetical protein CNEO_60099 [Clostridium neonatale]